jgi:hypothetical protein
MMRKGLLQPLVLAFWLAVGFGVLWGLGAAWVTEMVQHATRRISSDEYLAILQDGTGVRKGGVDSGGALQYRDLEGHSLPASAAEKEGGGVFLAAQLSQPRPHAPGVWDGSFRLFGDGRAPPVSWYFISDGRPQPHGYFVGYDSRSYARVGYLGTAGLRDEPLPASELIPFSGNADYYETGLITLQNIVYGYNISANRAGAAELPVPAHSISPWDLYILGHDHTIYRVDLGNRTVKRVFSDPGLVSLSIVSEQVDAAHGPAYRLAARTREAVLVLDSRGELRRRYPIPEPLQGQAFSFLPTSKGEAVMNRAIYRTPSRDEIEYYLWWVKPDGSTRQKELTLHYSSRSLPPLVVGLWCPAPLPVLTAGLTFGPWTQLENRLATTYSEGLIQSWPQFNWGLLLALVVGVLLAGLCYRRQVRYGASSGERWAWTIFVLLLGLPGWIAYRFGCSWPRLEACPACQTAVPRDRIRCARCGAEFPEPARKGTEVFA